MGERLDLSGYVNWREFNLYKEALRAQASEDALKERVRVLEAFRKDCAENWDCDTGANGTHHTHCRMCKAISLTGGKGEG